MGGTDQGSWLQANQAQANAAADAVQVQVGNAASEAWATALAAAPVELQIGIRYVGAAISGALAGIGGIVAASPAVASALGTIGLSAAVGDTVGPLGAVCGAVIGGGIALATGPWASGSTDNRSPVEKAQDAMTTLWLNGCDAQDMAVWYWDLEVISHDPSAGQGPG